ncbi:hypothetical protein M427DRAFT_59378 [Gonapodya prolifera JEL478]|uniref:SH3 domain-containing protein n=1 Tax=Gonapodya prolifera (strain JEL478) TaxID=1344416 RepID=A0A139A7I9_GONPJ|nr:hypothetical protein M427DRAFT_59378 [Gonapodya prolifera JEL478]|eukprot:KXS12638.1 hypothetical protein M427DRAFT_59378 [Gonapodya prolifera JEL478]
MARRPSRRLLGLLVVLASSPSRAQVFSDDASLFPVYCRDPKNVAVLFVEGPSTYEATLLDTTAGIVAPTALNFFPSSDTIPSYSTNLYLVAQRGALIGQRWDLSKDSAMPTMTLDQIRVELLSECVSIESVTGKIPKYLILPPKYVTSAIRTLATSMGFVTPGAGLDFEDDQLGVAPSSSNCSAHFAERLNDVNFPPYGTATANGLVAWMRDTYSCTASEAPTVFSRIKDKGYNLVDIATCFNDTRPYRNACNATAPPGFSTAVAARTLSSATTTTSSLASSSILPVSTPVLSTSSPEPSPSDPVKGVALSSAGGGGGGPMSAGAIAGLVVGIAVATLVVVALVALLYRRKTTRTRKDKESSGHATMNAPPSSRRQLLDVNHAAHPHPDEIESSVLTGDSFTDDEFAVTAVSFAVRPGMSPLPSLPATPPPRMTPSSEPGSNLMSDYGRAETPFYRSLAPPPSGSTIGKHVDDSTPGLVIRTLDVSNASNAGSVSAPTAEPPSAVHSLELPHSVDPIETFVAYGGDPTVASSVELNATYHSLVDWDPQNGDELKVDAGREVFVYLLYLDGWCLASSFSATGEQYVGILPFVILVPDRPMPSPSFAAYGTTLADGSPNATALELPSATVGEKTDSDTPPTSKMFARPTAKLLSQYRVPVVNVRSVSLNSKSSFQRFGSEHMVIPLVVLEDLLAKAEISVDVYHKLKHGAGLP